MANRRNLKKVINSKIAEIIDTCYDIIAVSPKSEEKMNKVIDEAVELYDDLIGAVNDYRSADNRSAYFKELEVRLLKEVEALNGKTKLF